jgi:LacI family transcriptional regulator
VEDAANSRGHHIIIGNTDESAAKQSEYIDFLLRKQVDGFVLVPASSRTIDRLLRQGRPVVLIDRTVPDVEVDTVRGDSEGGAYELVRHLVQLGHERISMIAGPRTTSTSVERVTGYERALAEAGLEGSRRVYWGTFSVEAGHELASQALAGPEAPTAFFAANNFIVLGVMEAIREAGLRVPHDVSIVTFDRVALRLSVDPFFTVAAQPEYEMGRQATELLLARLAGTGPESVQDIVLPTKIIKRGSSAGPPA